MSAADLKAKGNAAFAAKDFPTAIEHYTAAIDVTPKDAIHVIYSNRSACYASLKDYQKALEDAEQAINANPSFHKAYGRKGSALHGARKLEDAAAAFQEGLKLAPEDASLKKGLEEVKRAMDSDGGSGDSIGRMFSDPDMFSKIAANPKTAPLLADAGFVQKLKNIQANPADAGMAFQDPRMIQVMGVLMGVDLQAFERPEGSDELPEGIKRDLEEADEPMPAAAPAPKPAPKAKPPTPEPELPSEEAEAKAKGDAAKAKGNALYMKRDFGAAIEQYKAAWEAHKDISYLTNLAACYFEQGDFAQCIATCDEAVEKGRELRADYKLVAKAYARIGSAHAKQNDLKQAIRFYQKSLTEHRTAETLAKLQAAEKQLKEEERRSYIDPAKAEEERTRGNDLFRSGDFAGAVAAYTEAIKRNPEDARGYTNRASAYLKLLALSEALKDTDEALKIDSKSVKAYTRKANVLLSMKETTRALEAVQRAADVDEARAHAKEINELEAKITRALYEERANDTEEDVMARAQRDPEVSQILSDPVIQSILQQAQQNPAALQDHMKNPAIAAKIRKLVAVGIIKTR